MAVININDDIYKKLESIQKKDTVEHPSMKNFVDKILREYTESNGSKN